MYFWIAALSSSAESCKKTSFGRRKWDVEGHGETREGRGEITGVEEKGKGEGRGGMGKGVRLSQLVCMIRGRGEE